MVSKFEVKCPRCGKRGPWTESKWRPFCSERCRLVDLGGWLSGEYVISEPLRPDHFAEFAEEDDSSGSGGGRRSNDR